MAQEANDPLSATPRQLMQELLPAARRQYIKAWELLADPSTALDRRRLARKRASALAEEHATVADFLRGRESSCRGDDLRNLQHLIAELQRHAAAMARLSGPMAARALLESPDLRPEALGCGKRYRLPQISTEQASASRDASPKAKPRTRNQRGDRTSSQPDRGPKVPKEMLGSSKHDSQLGDSLDEATRARLEAMLGEQ